MENSLTPGGTVVYAGRTAQTLGCRVRAVTSADAKTDLTQVLPGVETLTVPAQATTTFDNRYTPTGRTQTIQAIAAPLTPQVVPQAWQTSHIVHLGPVARECDPALANLFPSAFLGLTPQGWMRRWDRAGRVHPAGWENADVLLPKADAVVLSEEDIADQALIVCWAGQTRLLAVTRGPSGCTIYAEGKKWELPAFPAAEVDPTGAGDIFAATLFVRLCHGDKPQTAARLANCIAAASVTRPGLSGIPTPKEVTRCLTLCA